jgi:hypothetical protein
LIIGGALSVLLLVVLLLSVISAVWKVNWFISDLRYKYDIMQHYLIMPFKRITKFLDDDDDY